MNRCFRVDVKSDWHVFMWVYFLDHHLYTSNLIRIVETAWFGVVDHCRIVVGVVSERAQQTFPAVSYVFKRTVQIARFHNSGHVYLRITILSR